MRLLLIAVAAALAAAFVPSAGVSPAQVTGSTGPGDAVVAVIDTGINPYHVEFRDTSDRAHEHPSTWLEGFPAGVPALELTLDAATYEEAMVADCEVWRSVQRGQLYWIPGTRIVGAASFQNADPSCNPATGALEDEAHILDSAGHGSMTASRAAASSYGACPDCLIVAIEFPTSIPLVLPTGSEEVPMEAIALAAEHKDWIDVQSNSWGPFVPVYDPARVGGLLGATPEFIEEVERVSAEQPAFWASGNGAAFRGGALGHPTPVTPHATPSAIMVGGHDSGYVTAWPGFPPHVVSDACGSWAAHDQTMDESEEDVGSGTSAATPFVAGNAAELLLTARRLLGDADTGQRDSGVMAAGDPTGITDGPLADGELTRAEWQRLLYATATERPEAQFEDGPPCGPLWAPYNETPVLWSDVPDAFPEYLNIGYGAVDDVATALAGEVLRGETPLPDRSDTDAYFEAHHTLGDATHQVYTTP